MIFPELLSIDKNSPWNREFGLSSSEVKTELFVPSMNFLTASGAAGIYLHLFPDNSHKPAVFYVGKEFADASAFELLNIAADNNEESTLFSSDANSATFSRVKVALRSDELTSLWYMPLVYKNKRFVGYVVCYFVTELLASDQQKALNRMLRGNIITHLSLCRERRLHADISEIQELVGNTNQHPIFAKDKDFRIVYANDAFLTLYPPEDRDKVLGFTTLESYDAQEADAFLEEDREAFRKGITKTIETIQLPNGETRTLETTKKSFQTTSGDQYILGVSYDLTQKHILINQLKQSNAELDKFSNIASHDLRAPINSIIKLSAWVKDDLEEIDKPELLKNIDQIQARAQRIDKLLEDLFEYSSAGRDKYDTSLIKLRSFIMELTPLLDLPDKTKLAIDDVELVLPRAPMEIVMLNLISNAVQHAETDQIKIEITAQKLKNKYIICVSDNGKGIEEQHKDLVFQLFETVSPQFEKAGSGKGLALVKKIVETYQGEVKLVSKPNAGCTIEITWPYLNGQAHQ